MNVPAFKGRLIAGRRIVTMAGGTSAMQWPFQRQMSHQTDKDGNETQKQVILTPQNSRAWKSNRREADSAVAASPLPPRGSQNFFAAMRSEDDEKAPGIFH
jgi:hypothetical protein